jgi:hypothetical protein
VEERGPNERCRFQGAKLKSAAAASKARRRPNIEGLLEERYQKQHEPGDTSYNEQ